MNIEFGLTKSKTQVSLNTCFAPLAALFAYYQQENILEPLHSVKMSMKKVRFSPVSKLQQVLLSILSGCEHISEVNTRLKPEVTLAQAWQLECFADQSGLSRTLDALTLMNIDQLREATTMIWRRHNRTLSHDWRGFLWLDFDLSGLPCGKRAEQSQKGYFSGKKTSPDANWHVSAPSGTVKPSGPICTRATNIPSIASSQRYWRPKML
jgi:hypothetical protein